MTTQDQTDCARRAAEQMRDRIVAVVRTVSVEVLEFDDSVEPGQIDLIADRVAESLTGVSQYGTHAPTADRDEAAHTLATAQAEIARYQALVVEWRTATREVEKMERKWGKTIALHTYRDGYTNALIRRYAAEIALAKSVTEVDPARFCCPRCDLVYGIGSDSHTAHERRGLETCIACARSQPPGTGWPPLSGYTDRQLASHLVTLNNGRSDHKIVDRTIELRIAAAERELARRNVRETRAQEDQRDLEVADPTARINMMAAEQAVAHLQAEIEDRNARLLAMTRCAADAARDTTAALVREGVALARMRDSERCRVATTAIAWRKASPSEAAKIELELRVACDRAIEHASIRDRLARLAETVTGGAYPEVAAELDQQLVAHPSEPEGRDVTASEDCLHRARIEPPSGPGSR